MTTYTTTINISNNDVAYLKENGYSLYAFKAVQAAGNGAPTVWFKLEKKKLLTKTFIEWEEDFSGYNSLSQIADKTVITTSNTIDTDLGNLITIDTNGNLSNTTDGSKASVSFLNKDTQKYTVGINQMVNNEVNTLCAFPILGAGAGRVITPISKIALIFSTDKLKTSTVITKAMSPGCFIDLTGTTDRTVEYSTDNGWSANGASWLKTINAFEDLKSLLIESPSKSSEELILERNLEREGA
ncbi:hypothetical protein Q8W40_24055 [Vibrio penaeicida]|uniref:hypothetical protein n=1 Tax=Vibrio penaeicida TaxID=104609 RepID=UPI002734BB0D|nr:hypothetical protein [Vibrio penaeicida]MDP2575292.1 hypothetical protein [Vibrio penaeicida]